MTTFVSRFLKNEPAEMAFHIDDHHHRGSCGLPGILVAIQLPAGKEHFKGENAEWICRNDCEVAGFEDQPASVF